MIELVQKTGVIVGIDDQWGVGIIRADCDAVEYVFPLIAWPDRRPPLPGLALAFTHTPQGEVTNLLLTATGDPAADIVRPRDRDSFSAIRRAVAVLPLHECRRLARAALTLAGAAWSVVCAKLNSLIAAAQHLPILRRSVAATGEVEDVAEFEWPESIQLCEACGSYPRLFTSFCDACDHELKANEVEQTKKAPRGD